MEVNVVEVFVEVDSASSVSSGGGEREHEVRDGACLGVQCTLNNRLTWLTIQSLSGLVLSFFKGGSYMYPF